MNKRQRNKRKKYEKKIAIETIDFLIKTYNITADKMQEELEKMPEGLEATCHDFFVKGFKHATVSLILAKDLIGESL